MKIEKIALTVLCAAVCAWVAKMLVGVVGLARHQDISARVAGFELSIFLGAGLLPIIAVWCFEGRTKRWLYLAWTPCILYVSFLSINYARFSPFAGLGRLLLWSVIIILFVRESKKTAPV